MGSFPNLHKESSLPAVDVKQPVAITKHHRQRGLEGVNPKHSLLRGRSRTPEQVPGRGERGRQREMRSKVGFQGAQEPQP